MDFGKISAPILVHLSAAFKMNDHKLLDRNVWNGSQLVQVVCRRVLFGHNAQNPVQSLRTLTKMNPSG